MKKYIYAVMLIMGIFVGLSGCATPQYGQDIDARIDRIEQGLALNRQEINDLKITMGALSATVQDAINRAEEAGKLAQGKFLFEATISDDSVFFAFDKNELTDEGRKALDVFAEVMKAESKNIYIEIQGHTDGTGPEEYNLELGFKRAKSVMKYLHLNHNLPLRCMNEFSYGESRPVADNAIRKNRAKNRRVTIVGMV
jgi:outer membrane protein OmpA-like peptidoglycan-associated protein